MKQKTQQKSEWEKPLIQEVTLDWDKDVLARCQTSSGGNAAVDVEFGCQNPDHNTKCN